MKQISINHPGFTIVELLIYMGVSAIILVSLTQVFVMIGRLRLESQSYSLLQQDGVYLLSRLSYDVARSGSISTPILGAQGNVLQTDKVRYFLDSNRLRITDSVGTEFLTGGDITISNLNFHHLDGGTHENVRVSFTLTSQIKEPSGLQTKDFSTTVGTR
ncbi:hypothetical protein A3K29_02695 [Candidatus Collierbacteria bacterium RIFOXYB2_FULL_46_14]|uniref:Prepilin-type N-terminal cleavage/methylation domain-containing protein n=1 Tax=Candidatus Collierbacteria bacterium GW2011_GWA2_46_26 TaxID=1618381 RepID=A0A0G1PM78_9BACT|nr:MAG: hypothetical protein UW29_C0004G0044 [Candidatus Collierbacteria bacterium GW2011_GWC2_44_13]KKU33904.1 MAG: hypothetical protein UX47_C0001G0187 [Candidatus Collierbacteria bacterium GW2011_GWA2_46_26]OGD73027.1 MAG: hypothetical protein A3K29_02695 [Candidatus Collierbacteria bacterium RIFOXYB2_FULL_46_14]OGD76069.1 MAG: hypothetical protein A3K43_02695 [Candidatus Collierbacteria bacterium RIFOXYA2_FULL_46_20]OGD77405.1 MAG: hypothetical protein A3K39_02695 [Candidatus Collierbacteri